MSMHALAIFGTGVGGGARPSGLWPSAEALATRSHLSGFTLKSRCVVGFHSYSQCILVHDGDQHT
jgi:hypothetical protein